MYALIAAAALALTGPQVGQRAPDFHLTTVDGKSVALADFRGKTLVLNDWATWCPPCREETPDLIASAKHLAKGGDVVFLGIDSTESAPIVRAFVASKSVPYRQAIDVDNVFLKAYDVTAFPTTYVIDPAGVLRARYVGNVTPPILSGFVADARAGRDGVLATAAQKKVDAMLDPAGFAFTGDAGTIRAAVQTVFKKIDAAEAIDGDTDYLRTQREENVLRDAAVSAFGPVAQTDADRVVLARLQGDAAVARERLDDATAAYSRGLALAPNDPDLLGGYADALRRQHEYSKAIDAYAKLAELDPSVDAFVELGEVQAAAHRFNDASVTYGRAIGAARAAAGAKPADVKARRKLAWTYLKAGRMYAKAGETAHARASFAQTTALAGKLPKTDSRYAMYLEQAQEETVALDASHPQGKTSLSLAPWTGADLPGSVASTYKYRLVVSGKPGKTIALSTSRLPKKWIASFCSDRVCVPFRTTVALPESGVKVIEFQLIPQSAATSVPAVRVEGDGATAVLPPTR